MDKYSDYNYYRIETGLYLIWGKMEYKLECGGRIDEWLMILSNLLQESSTGE